MARDITKPLSIPLFPQDFMGCAYVQGMTYEEIGCYIWLMMISWQLDPPCTIPADKGLQARLLRLSAEHWLTLSTAVLMPWHDLGNGRLEQKRLRREWDYLMAKKEAGSKGGDAKALANGKHTPSTSGSKPLADDVGNGKQTPSPYPSPPLSVSLSESLPDKPKSVKPKPSQTATRLLSEMVWEQCVWRKVNKQDGIKAIDKAIAIVADREKIAVDAAAQWLASKAAEYSASPLGMRPDKEYRPHPASWFNKGSYDDPPEEWQHKASPPISAKAQIRADRQAREPEQDFSTLKIVRL